jgi:hypothetical protein
MVFQLNAQIPIAYRGYDYGRSQQNALRGLQMDAAEREIGEQNALAAAYREGGAGLASDDPAQRTAAAARIAAVGPRGYALAAPVLQRARDEGAVSRIFGGGGAAAPAPAASPMAAPAGGADPLVRIAAVESGGNDAARNPRSSAAGRFQIIDSTWNQYAPRLGLRPEQRMDPAAQEQVARAIQADAAQQIGRPLSQGEAYGAHFLGIGGLRAFLSAPPNADAMQVYAQAAGPQIAQQAFRSNPGLLEPGMTVGQVMERLNGRMGGGGAIPASAQGGGQQRMPGQPTQAQFAQLMQQAATGNEVAQRLVQNWMPFMRREAANFQLTEIDGQRVAVDPRDPNNRVILGRAGGGESLSPGGAQQAILTLAPRIASGNANEQEVREYLAALNVATTRVSDSGVIVQTPLPPFAPPMAAVLQMYPGVAFQAPQAAPQAAPGAAPMVAPQAAPQTPAAAGDAAPATVQLPPPPGPIMPGPGGGVSRPAGPGGTVANQIEERQFNAAEQISRLNAIRRDFRPEHQTFAARLSNRWAALREIGGRNLSPQERQQLTEYTQSRARSLENLNFTIQAVTGAAMGIEEAQRIIATMPNPGTGLFDGDSPTEFQAKLDRATTDVQNAIIRYSLARQRGVDPLRSGIRLEDVPGLVNQRGEEIAREIRADNPRLSENAVRQQVDARLGAELGLR